MEIINKLSDKFKTIYELAKNNPSQSFKYVLLVLLGLMLLFLLQSLFELMAKLVQDRQQEKQGLLMEILPKETASIKDTEKLLKNLHGVLLNTKLRKMLHGRPTMSFEIAAEKDKIKFYIRIPKDYKNEIRNRIYETYKEIAISEVEEDYIPDKVWVSYKEIGEFLYRLVTYPFKKVPFEIPKNHLAIYGTEMELGYHHVLKIKTKAEKDIIGSILAGMKDMEWHEKAIVQVIVRPLDNDWQIKGRKILEDFEINGRRPVRGNDFMNFIGAFADQFVDDMDDELQKSGINFGESRKGKKTRMERKEITVASEKLLESGFETVIRVAAIGHFRKGNTSKVKGITAAFNELDQDNRFKRDIIWAKKLFFERLKKRRAYLVDRNNILTTSELANFFLRLPGNDLIEMYQDIESLRIKEFAPPKNVEMNKNIFAMNYYRGKETMIGIKDKDLVRHLVVQGKTGTGKSEWFKTIGLNHIKRGLGLMLLEPHGKLADEFLELIPEERRKDVIYFDLFDSHPPEFNFCKVFDRKGMSYEDVVEKTIEEVIEIFKRNFSDAWSSKNEHYITNAIKTVIELRNGNMLDIQRLFIDKEFREYAVSQIKDPQVKHFWKTDFKEVNGKLPQGTENTVLSVMNKLGKFLNSKKLLRSIGQEDCIDFKDIIDNNKIIIFRFSKEKMSEDRISFLGGIAIKLLIVASFARDKARWNDPYLVVLDEAQNFISKSIETVLDELRKYGIVLLPMHQRLAQLDKVEGLKDAIYGNVGTSITFTVGQSDVPYFEKIYGPRVDQDDLKRLPSRFGYCKLLVDGEASDTFNIYSLDRPEVPKEVGKKAVFDIKKNNRENRMHFKEIDKMLRERIADYKKVDEVGDIESPGFVEEVENEFEIASKVQSYQKGFQQEDTRVYYEYDEIPWAINDNTNDVNEDQDQEYDDARIEISYPWEDVLNDMDEFLDTEDQEGYGSSEEYIEDQVDDEIVIRDVSSELDGQVEIKVESPRIEIMQPIEEKVKVEKPGLRNDAAAPKEQPKNRPIMLADFLESKDIPTISQKVKQEVAVSWDEEPGTELQIQDKFATAPPIQIIPEDPEEAAADQEKEETDNIPEKPVENSIWNNAKVLEERAKRELQHNRKDEKQLVGADLWKAAALKEQELKKKG